MIIEAGEHAYLKELHKTVTDSQIAWASYSKFLAAKYQLGPTDWIAPADGIVRRGASAAHTGEVPQNNQ